MSRRLLAPRSNSPRSLREPELSYPIQHQEMLSIVACVAAFENFLLCAHFIVRVCSDHKSLTSSFRGLSKQACDRITRWVQKTCCFNMDLYYMPGCDMHLSTLVASRSLFYKKAITVGSSKHRTFVVGLLVVGS